MAIVKVITPSKIFNGVRGGVAFHKGVGIFTDEKLAKEVATKFGYKMEVEKPKPAPKPTPKPKPAAKSK